MKKVGENSGYGDEEACKPKEHKKELVRKEKKEDDEHHCRHKLPLKLSELLLMVYTQPLHNITTFPALEILHMTAKSTKK